jgi:hypothetical protein
VLLEHAVGSSGASGAPPTRISTGEHHKFDAGARRIPQSLKEQLLTRRRLGGRYGGTDFSNVGNLGHAVWIQLLIATAVVIVTASWRRLRFRRRRV